MSLIKARSRGINLADTFNFTGTLQQNGGAVAGGKLLKVEKFINAHDVTTSSSSYSTMETFSFTPTSSSSTIYFFLSIAYQLYGNNSTTNPSGKFNLTSEATGSDVIIGAQDVQQNSIHNTNTGYEEQCGSIFGSQASAGTSAFNINLRVATLGSGRLRVFPSDGTKVNPTTLIVQEVGA
jgi:hypothetical protein